MLSEAVKVIVRCRPMNSREKGLKCKVILRENACQKNCPVISRKNWFYHFNNVFLENKYNITFFSAMCFYGSRNLQMFYSQCKRFNCLTKIFHFWWSLLHWFHYRTNIQWNCLSTGGGNQLIIKHFKQNKNSVFGTPQKTTNVLVHANFCKGYKWNVKLILYSS